jgi:integrase
MTGCPWQVGVLRIADVRLHDLRHTVGSHAGQSGANAFLVRDLLRHKNLAMTGRYVNPLTIPCARSAIRWASRGRITDTRLSS